MVDNLRLYYSDATHPSGVYNSISSDRMVGYLKDAINCFCECNYNGGFEIKMEYPSTGEFVSNLTHRAIIVVTPYDKHNAYSTEDAFRIYSINKRINGLLEISAQHISYDLSNYVVEPFKETTWSGVYSRLQTAISDSGFSLSTKSGVNPEDKDFEITSPITLRNLLSQISNKFDVAVTFDMYHVIISPSIKTLRNQTDYDFSIEYSVNMLSLTVDEDSSKAYGKFYPYYKKGNSSFVTLDKNIYPRGILDYGGQNLYIMDLSSKFESTPTSTQLLNEATSVIEDEDLTIYNPNIDVDFRSLKDSTETLMFKELEQIYPGAIVRIVHKDLGLEAISVCINSKWNCLLGKYDTVTIGKEVTDIASASSEPVSSVDTSGLVTAESIKELLGGTFLSDLGNITELSGFKLGYVDPNEDPVTHFYKDLDLTNPVDPEEGVFYAVKSVENFGIYKYDSGSGTFIKVTTTGS